MKNNKKGFTLVELIAVIAILGVILLLVVPNVIGVLASGKKDAFARQVQSVWREAQKQYNLDYAKYDAELYYCNDGLITDEMLDYYFNNSGGNSVPFPAGGNAHISGNGSSNKLCKKLSLNKNDLQYIVFFDDHGELMYIAVGNNDYCYTGTSKQSMDIKGSDITEGQLVCNNSGSISLNKPCTCAEGANQGQGGSEPTTLSEYSFDYTGDVQVFNVSQTGTYKLQVWGAEGGGYSLGGNSDSGNGGKGGYTEGYVQLNSGDTLYVYVGGAGESHPSSYDGPRLTAGGFNGGGYAYGSYASEPGNGGGGATDIRINNDSLYARVIVAGGGGGGGEDSGDSVGAGGGLTSTSGGGYSASITGSDGSGTFGQGAHTNGDGGGGGGGWYGGGAAEGITYIPSYNSSNDNQGSAGGSGWYYDQDNYNQWSRNTSEGSSGQWLLDSDYYVDCGDSYNGEEEFVSPSGSTETGHSSNGYAKISYIGNATYTCTPSNHGYNGSGGNDFLLR